MRQELKYFTEGALILMLLCIYEDDEGINFSEIEFTQCLVFFSVKRSPLKT